MPRPLVLAAAALALAAPVALSAQVQLDTTVTFDAHGGVTVSCPGGAVIVTSADRPEVRVHARTGRGAIRFTSTGTRATLEPSSGHGCSDGRFEVVVPTGSHVSANTWNGTVSVRGVAGDVEAHSMNGDIDVRDIGGHLDAESISGDVTASQLRGDASLTTVSGSVTLDGARGAVEAETVSGDVTLRGISARQVRAHSTSGDVSYAGDVAESGRYEFETHSGQVLLRLPATVGAQLGLSTYSGTIDSDFPITLKAGQPGMGSAANRRMDFALGQGTARIVAETFSGSITLRSAARRQ